MRISNLEEQRTQILDLQRLGREMARQRTCLGSGQKLEQASDDPLLAVRSMDIRRRVGAQTIWLENIQELDSRLAVAETLVGRCVTLIREVYETLVHAHNDALGASDRKALAASVRAACDSFVAMINTRDTEGIYLFGGEQSFMPPVTRQSDGSLEETGGKGERVRVAVADDIVVESVDTADAVFFRVPEKTGAGVFSVLDFLTTMDELLSTSPADFHARLAEGINAANQVSEHLLLVRTALGGRLRQLDALGESQKQEKFYSERLLHQLEDLDYATSISRINQLEMATEAARKTLVQITRSSLFQAIQP